MVQFFFSNTLKISANALILNEEENTGKEKVCVKLYICKKKIHTKIHKFDPSLCCQQDVIAFDITVDGLVDVKVLEALQRRGR